MFFWISLIGYVTVALVVVIALLWGKAEGNSVYDRLYSIACVLFPRGIKAVLRKCFGDRGPEALDRGWNYLCFQSNPLVQIFYLCVVVGGYLTFVACGYSKIPNAYVGAIHKPVGFIIFLTCLLVWWKACSTDPGIVTPQNVEDLCEVWQWDDQIFGQSKCTTCSVPKPARSKHCSLCGVCVSKFDHHCIWLNNCVGVGNHKYFLLFLFWHVVICAYGSALSGAIIVDVVKSKGLFAAVFVDPVTKDKLKASWTVVLQYLMATEGMVVFVGLLCIVMGTVLFGFLGWHLYLVKAGTTTNELQKWSYMRWCLKQEGDEGKEAAKHLKNIYNKGLRANFSEVFFPINVHKLPRQLRNEAKKTGVQEQQQGKMGQSGRRQHGGKQKAKKT